MTDPRVMIFLKSHSTIRIIDEDNLAIISETSSTPEQKAALDAEEILNNRRMEYPPIGDQLDDLYKAVLFSSIHSKTKSSKG